MLTHFDGPKEFYEALPAFVGSPETVELCRVNTLHGMVLPNLDEWRAGDVVLSSAHPPNPVDPISIYQFFLYPDIQVARWTHVGIYDGRGFVWDANPNANVQARSVADYLISKPAISLVRMIGEAIDPHRLLDEIDLLKNRRYDMGPLAAMLLFRVFRGVGKPRPAEPVADFVVCSTFIEHVFRHLDRDCFSRIGVVVPADYRGSGMFSRVPLRWHRLGTTAHKDTA